MLHLKGNVFMEMMAMLMMIRLIRLDVLWAGMSSSFKAVDDVL